MNRSLAEKFRLAKEHVGNLATALRKLDERYRQQYDDYGLNDPMKAMTWTGNAEICDRASSDVADLEDGIDRIKKEVENGWEYDG